METNFTNQILQLDSVDLVVRAMQERRAQILEAIAAKELEPSEELMKELAELNIGIGDVDAEATCLQVQNAQLRQKIQQVEAVTESLEQLGEKLDRLFGEQP